MRSSRVALVLLLALAGRARADGPAPATATATAAPTYGEADAAALDALPAELRTVRMSGRLPWLDPEDPFDDTVTIEFALYGSPTGGEPVWREKQKVKIARSRIDVRLGSQVPLPDAVFTQTFRYVGVRFDGEEELTPRFPIECCLWARAPGEVPGLAKPAGKDGKPATGTSAATGASAATGPATAPGSGPSPATQPAGGSSSAPAAPAPASAPGQSGAGYVGADPGPAPAAAAPAEPGKLLPVGSGVAVEAAPRAPATWLEATLAARKAGGRLPSAEEWLAAYRSGEKGGFRGMSGHYEWVQPFVFSAQSYGAEVGAYQGKLNGCMEEELSPSMNRFVWRMAGEAKE